MLKLLRDLSISSKLRVIVVLTSNVALFLACAAFLSFTWFSLRNSMKRDKIVLAEAIATNSTAALAFDDGQSAREILTALGADPQVFQAALYRRNGSLLASYRRNQDSRTSQEFPRVEAEGAYFRDDSLMVYRRIVLDGELIGTLYIGTRVEALNALFRIHFLVTLLILAAASLLTYGLSSRLLPLISRPVLDLARTARKVSEVKDYSIRAVKENNDEIGDLIDRFNDMLAQIQQRDDEQRRVQEELQNAKRGAEAANQAK
ncbi:MAG TPA: CHASE sensor domain-containing protein, partial [Acidobacteriota bacterium]|nr:CHASE sensor domain-containing protein [Acidobacteriota bacterium]